jgi:Na+-driven multidrug efflux pump
MGFLVMTILCVPAMVLFQFGEFFIRNVFRQDEHLSRMGGRYTQLLLPGLWFMCMFIVMQVRAGTGSWGWRKGSTVGGR